MQLPHSYCQYLPEVGISLVGTLVNENEKVYVNLAVMYTVLTSSHSDRR